MKSADGLKLAKVARDLLNFLLQFFTSDGKVHVAGGRLFLSQRVMAEADKMRVSWRSS